MRILHKCGIGKNTVSHKSQIPHELYICGQNPLLLIDRVLSKKAYVRTEQEFSILSKAIRLILTELVKKFYEKVQDKSELNQLVSYIME